MKNMENDNLTIALRINGRESKGAQSEVNDESIQANGSQDGNESVILKAKIINNNIKDEKIIKELPKQNKIYENNCKSLESEMKNLEIVEELLNDNSSIITNHEAEVAPNMENGDLVGCSNNCVCFCNENDGDGGGGAHHVISIVENGFFGKHNRIGDKGSDEEGDGNSQDDEDVEDNDDDEAAEDCDDDDDIDESDLPNYSRSCVYEERIIDFENFRIIEQVIDNNCEGKHTAANNVKCRNVKECKRKQEEQVTETEAKEGEKETNSQLELPSGSKTIQTATPIYVNPALNFSCSELVAFIGESYQVIDNAQAFYNNDKTSKPKKSTQYKTKSESCSVGNSPFKRSKRSGYGSGNASSSNRSVDDNNNTARVTGITAAERLMQSLNCDVSRELTQTKRVEKREVKTKSKAAVNAKTATPTKTLLKALKSKLTPLAPPFQPAASKNKNAKISGAAANSNSATLVNYEQTTIYYHQNHQQQQQQQQQQILANNMLHALCLNTANQQHILQQQQLSPSQQQLFLAQQHHHLQLQPSPAAVAPQHQHILQTHNPTHPHQHHQQHCAQNILAMSAASLAGQGMPHIHLPAAAAATASATTNNGNLSSTATAATAVINVAATNPASHHHPHQQHHLLPIHLISAVGSSGAGGGVGGVTSSWPLLEPSNSASNNATATVTTTPIYMDFNGELRSICPAHGPPPTAVTITTPLAPITNQASTASTTSNPNNIMQQQNTVCLNPSQYPLTVTAQYHAATQHQQNQAQLHHHLQQQQQQQHHHHSHHLTQQQQQQHHHHQSSLANSQNSPLRIKSTALTQAVASNSSSTSSSTSGAAATTSSSTAAIATTSTPPRVVLQLDAGVSLPLQIAGKRKIFRGECTFYYDS